MVSILALIAPLFTACSDEPEGDNFRTFSDEMMSTYLKNRSQYSLFTEVVTRAKLMDLLSAYGSYTCFLPTNQAMETYLSGKGLSAVSQMSDADCDTLARTHMLDVLYSSYSMPEGVLTQPNMNNRYLTVSRELDESQNQIICINGDAHVIRELQDDSVTNGIIHPIDKVLESSTDYLADVIGRNPNLKLFTEALSKTKLKDSMALYRDPNYQQVLNQDGTAFFFDYTTGDRIYESARSPKEKLYGYTAFIVPDNVLKEKYGIETLEQLYNKACEIYDPIYGGINEDYHKFKNSDTDFSPLTDRRNPLNRLISYHLLNRNVHGYNLLTVVNNYGIRADKINPTEWYQTLFPYAMMKVEKVTVDNYVRGAVKNDIYLNRREDDRYSGITGAHVLPTVEGDYNNEALNGIYFLIDDLLKYDNVTKDQVMNCRMRMDMSTIFPEVMTNSMRMNYKSETALFTNDPTHDHSETYGTNYFFPEGYLEGVKVSNNGYFIYRRPRLGFYSYCGDEFICQGNFDVTFRIPPVPTEGDYQVRLGFAAMKVRGIVQIYFDENQSGKMEPQGIPLDMRHDLSHTTILGSTYWNAHANYDNLSDEQKSEELKELKNKGYYRGAYGANTSWSLQPILNYTGTPMSNMAPTLRLVLCTVHIRPNEDHHVRVRLVSENLNDDPTVDNNNEAMLDYIEIVPKSVYGITDEGMAEDPL